jgi:hypothetical protein
MLADSTCCSQPCSAPLTISGPNRPRTHDVASRMPRSSRSPSPKRCWVLLLDPTPVECGRSVETARRSQLADACDYGHSRSHSRWFWGVRPHLSAAPDRTPRTTIPEARRPNQRDLALRLLPIAPNRQHEPGHRPHLAPIHQYIESILRTPKHRLRLKRHNTRTPTAPEPESPPNPSRQPPASSTTTNSTAPPEPSPANPTAEYVS